MVERLLLILALVGCALVGLASTTVAGPQYTVEWQRRGPSLGERIMASDTKSIPPASISGSDMAHDGINGLYLYGYSATAGARTIDLSGDAVTYSLYNVDRSDWFTGSWRWDDVQITCDDMRATVSAGVRVHVKGSASGFVSTYQTNPSGSVALYLGHPQFAFTQGVWFAGSSYPPQVSTGVFAGSTGDQLDQTVTWSLGQVTTGTPLQIGVPFTLAISELNYRVIGNFDQAHGGGISLPTDGPVFDLPSGCTCNSQQMDVIDNRIAYRVTASAGTGGGISPSGSVVVNHGTDQVFSIAADPCYSITDVLVDGVSVGAVGSYTFSGVSSAHTIAVSFTAAPPSIIAASAGSGGVIAPAGAVSVACGENRTFGITPAACYHITDVLVDGVSVGAVSSCTFNGVTAGHTIAASFAIDSFTIAASAGSGGSISPSGSTAVNCGANQSFAIAPIAGYSIADVLVDGVSVGAVGAYAFNDVRANHTIAANFQATGGGTLSATIFVRSQLHSIESGSRPRSVKAPMALELKVFVLGAGPEPKPQNYAAIWNSGTGLAPPNKEVSGPVVVRQGDGDANEYTLRVSAGSKYLVVGRASVTCNGVLEDVYVGRPTDVLAANSTTRKHLYVMQRADGRCLPATTDEIPGSLLLVSQPEYLEFESPVELLPIVYQSVDGDWGVTVEASPPEGFVSDPAGSLSATLTDNTQQVLQFTITDVGSDWTYTRISHHIQHNGRRIERVGATGMINRRGRPGGPKNGGTRPGTEAANTLPTAYALEQNYPEPFNPQTMVRFDLPEPAEVTLEVYDVAGRRVAILADHKHYEAGRYSELFDAGDRPAGIYFYRIRAGSFTSARKMILLK